MGDIHYFPRCVSIKFELRYIIRKRMPGEWKLKRCVINMIIKLWTELQWMEAMCEGNLKFEQQSTWWQCCEKQGQDCLCHWYSRIQVSVQRKERWRGESRTRESTHWLLACWEGPHWSPSGSIACSLKVPPLFTLIGATLLYNSNWPSGVLKKSIIYLLI